jgi:glycosyltransferase involved in cell wall biosynthesis
VSARVLLTVSGTVPADLDEQVATRARPRADYVEVARALDALLLDRPAAAHAAGRLGRLIRRVAGDDVVLAWVCFRRRAEYDVVVTDGEQVGMPLAVLLLPFARRPRHAMVVHILSPRKKSVPFRLLRLGRRIDVMFTYASAQRQLVIDRLGGRPEQVVLTPFMVDTEYFAPDAVARAARPAGGRPLVCSAGLEFRDYPTLVEAVRGLDVDVVLAAASPWSRRRDTSADVELPSNVEVRRLGFADLRQLYADADVVVVPVVETDFQAGITTILEAMAMGKPVICTRTAGQTDTIVDGETGIYVPPGDAVAMRGAIERVTADRELRHRLGEAARRWAVEHADVSVYARRLAEHVRRVLPTATTGA